MRFGQSILIELGVVEGEVMKCLWRDFGKHWIFEVFLLLVSRYTIHNARYYVMEVNNTRL